jgi:hypothetical protein
VFFEPSGGGRRHPPPCLRADALARQARGSVCARGRVRGPWALTLRSRMSSRRAATARCPRAEAFAALARGAWPVESIACPTRDGCSPTAAHAIPEAPRRRLGSGGFWASVRVWSGEPVGSGGPAGR